MRINVSGFQGEGKSILARKIADSLHQLRGRSVRLVDGCNSENFIPEDQKGKKVFDDTIRVRTIHTDVE